MGLEFPIVILHSDIKNYTELRNVTTNNLFRHLPTAHFDEL